MPLHQPVCFPLHPIRPDGACGCGLPSCSRIGKHPAVAWKDLELGSEVPVRAEGAGVGIKTGARPRGSGVFVVDLDGREGFDWLTDRGYPDTYTVSTGRDCGLQLYFQHPGFYVKNSRSELAPWIDIRGDGGFVVSAGSPHASGRMYRVVSDVDPAPAPEWLLEWLRAQPSQGEIQVYDGDVEGPERERRVKLYRSWLETAPPCVSGQGGDEQLWEVVQYGAYDLALPVGDVLSALQDVYDPRCFPPWEDELERRVARKAHDAKTGSTRPRRGPLLEVEEEILGGLELEPTAFAKVELAVDDEDLDCGFEIRWGGWDQTPQDPLWLIDNLLILGTVTMLFAEPGSIKTWLAISAAAAVAGGHDWLGEKRVRQSPTLYVDFEDGQNEFHRRVHKLENGLAIPGLGYLNGNMGSVSDTDFWNRLARLKRKRGVEFFVIDTLAGASVGVDENDQTAADPLKLAGKFAEKTGATVLFIHHANRQGEIRGTSAFKAATDTLFKLETIKDEDGVHQARLTCVKSGQKKVPTVCLELTDEHGLRRFDPPTEVKDEGKNQDRRTFDELVNEVRMTIGSYEDRDPISSLERLRQLVKGKSNTVADALKDLIERGDVVKRTKGYYLDDDNRRAERLKAAIEAHEDWGKGKLLSHTFVSGKFFDDLVRQGRVVPVATGKSVDGYLWIDS
jgi:hypothetical protein